MRIDAGQHLRMSQQMKLAPRMIQSMEILQMPQAALEARIEQELTSNPTLEVQEESADRDEVRAELHQEERDSREGERPLIVSDDGQANGTERGKGADDFERLSNFADEYGESFAANTYETGDYEYRSRAASSGGDGERDRKLDALANTAARGASLFDQLMDQWRLIETTPEIHRAGEYLIGFIDADGYIRTPEDQLAAQLPSGLTRDQMIVAWGLLQETLDPPGLAARDLRECLLLQIDARAEHGHFNAHDDRDGKDSVPDLSLERTLVDEHLKDIEANRLPRIAKTLDRPVEEIKRAILNLRQFQPHPGRQLTDDTPRTITPDAIVEYDEESDTYVATLTHGHLPSLNINPHYRRMLKNAAVDKRTRDFVGNNLRSARWLIDAIRQRHSTLLRVINVVLQAQRDYFDQGPQALKPLPMTLVADQLGIHVATVSRAVHEKYLQTPRGIVPLRMFFSGGTETDSGESMSWTAVQAKLEQLINEEDKQTPLSDDQLVDELKKHGIEIARRTVAKYRKQLNIPPARQRKEY